MDQMRECFGDEIQLEGKIDAAIRSLVTGLYARVSFRRLADWFRERLDPFAAGEFWGKMMRSACLCWRYTRDAGLESTLRDAMRDMLGIQRADGCVSTAPDERQPFGQHGSDIWERKYVLLGMWAYYETFGDDAVLEAACRLADYTCSQVGAPPKTPITSTGWAFCGIESSSILEPIVKLYNRTGKAAYLDLARHIVEETGGCSRESVFAAIENGRDPMSVGGNGDPAQSIAKSYEMMSCFEGLIEYWRATGNGRWLRIAGTFWEKVREQEITLLGSGGADRPFNLGPGTGEQWNRTAREQTNPDITLMMETCVTITWMKLCVQLLRATGESRIFDEVERSIYNALLGAMRPDGAFFDYFPPFNGKRGNKENFVYDIDGFSLSCCTANGPAGLCLMPFAAVMRLENGAALNLFAPMRYRGALDFDVATAYPADGLVRVTITADSPGERALWVRVPAWSRASLAVNGEAVPCVPGRYAKLVRLWRAGDAVTLALDLPLRAVPAPHGSNPAGDAFVAYTYGPLLLARDKRFDPGYDEPVAPPEGERPAWKALRIEGTQFAARVGGMTLVDYASAGATWDEASLFRSWLSLRR